LTGRPVGRIGRPHGLDGSFVLEMPAAPPRAGEVVVLDGREVRVERHAGTAVRPILRVSGVSDRSAAAALRGRTLVHPTEQPWFGEDEWAAEAIVGCRIEGLGEVRRIVSGPSCDVLEVGEGGTLVPFISDAIRRVDTDAGVIEVHREFLGLPPEQTEVERS
jgi:16S rRNA processing protein RimM